MVGGIPTGADGCDRMDGLVTVLYCTILYSGVPCAMVSASASAGSLKVHTFVIRNPNSHGFYMPEPPVPPGPIFTQVSPEKIVKRKSHDQYTTLLARRDKRQAESGER